MARGVLFRQTLPARHRRGARLFPARFAMLALFPLSLLTAQTTPALQRADNAWARFTLQSNFGNLAGWLLRENDPSAQRHLVRLARSNLGASMPVDLFARALAQSGQSAIILDTLFAPLPGGGLPFDRRPWLPILLDALATQGEWNQVEREAGEAFAGPQPPPGLVDILMRLGQKRQHARLEGLFAAEQGKAAANQARAQNLAIARAFLAWGAEDWVRLAARLREIAPSGDPSVETLRAPFTGELESLLMGLYRAGRDLDFHDAFQRFGQVGFSEGLGALDRLARRRLGMPVPLDPRFPIETLFLQGAFDRIVSDLPPSTRSEYLFALLACGRTDEAGKRSAKESDRAFWEFASACFRHETDAVGRLLSDPGFGQGDERLLAIRAAVGRRPMDGKQLAFLIPFQKLCWTWNTNAELLYMKERAELPAPLSDYGALSVFRLWIDRGDAASIDRFAQTGEKLIHSASSREVLRFLWGRNLFPRDRERARQVLGQILVNRPQTPFRYEIVRMMRD